MSLAKPQGIFLILILGGIGFLGWVLPGSSSSSCPSSSSSPCLTKVQSSTTSCILSAATVCSSVVTFSPAFASTPKAWDWIVTSVGVGQLNGFQAYFNLQPTTWTSMPAAQTELFGYVNGEDQVLADLSNAANIRFAVNCPVVSSSATPATLQVQYSVNQGVTWTNIAGLVLNLDGLTSPSCFNLGLVGVGPENYVTSYVGVPAGAKTSTTLLRVVGTNGGGVGDNPQFSIVSVQWQTSFSVCSDNVPSVSTTSMTVRVSCVTPITGTITSGWAAGILA